MQAQAGNRWVIAAAGVVITIPLGGVYAWSVFFDPLVQAFGWTTPEVTLTFTIAIVMTGFAAFGGGLGLERAGPRPVAMVGGVLYGLGVLGAGLAADRLWLLYLTYGLAGGAGIGLAYIVPLATLVRWFPDRRGFITGLAVAGFGAGALVTAPVAARLIQAVGVMATFAILGVVYLVVVVGGALFMCNPPKGYRPAGWQPATWTSKHLGDEYTLRQALGTWQWYALAATLFLSVSAGISILSEAAPMAIEITGVSALEAAGLVSILAIANGAGRLLWAWLSDFVGRKWVYLAIFLLQAVVCSVLPLTTAFAVFAALAFVILLCFGGGLGTMPAFAADYFGEKHVGAIYGLMLAVFGFSSVPGPLVMASVRQSTGSYSAVLYLLAGVMLVSALLPLVLRPPRPLPATEQTPDTPAPAPQTA